MDAKPRSGGRLHFVGVGGAGRSGHALTATTPGAEVTGSDRAESGYMGPLREAGIEPVIGHDVANVPPGAEIVVSTAIPDDNPEVAAAAGPVLRRRDFLAEVSRLKRCIAIAGTHGKTTTACMAAHALLGATGSRCRVMGAELELRVPGRHNVLNALGALIACERAGLPPSEAAAALRTFPGAGRRLERRGETASGAAVYDDYAHHPTEVSATLEAARLLGSDRVVACFQPHLYSRTRAMAREFGRSLALADVACVLDVYPARERAEDFQGVTGWLVAAATADASGGRPVYWTPSMDDAERLLRETLEARDLVITI